MVCPGALVGIHDDFVPLISSQSGDHCMAGM
jgi:hypothetical protein